MTDNEDQQMRVPTLKNEFNLNTFVLLVGLVFTFGKVFYDVGQAASDIGAIVAGNAHRDAKIVALEQDTRQLDNLAYRMAVQEQGTTTLSRSVEELKNTMNTLGADIRVMKEILTRQDAATRGP
jgi:uncharacterized coiled-coil protein SlyX